MIALCLPWEMPCPWGLEISPEREAGWKGVELSARANKGGVQARHSEQRAVCLSLVSVCSSVKGKKGDRQESQFKAKKGDKAVAWSSRPRAEEPQQSHMLTGSGDKEFGNEARIETAV